MRQSSQSSPFDEFMRDVVTLQKQTGEQIEGIKAQVQKGLIVIRDETFPAEDGDIILRPLPNGYIERYTILDLGYRPAFYDIPASFQMQVRKETSVRDDRAASVVNTYNMHGANTRVNIGSNDNSYNTVNTSSENLFADLRKVILSIENSPDRNSLISAVQEMESTLKTPGFIEKYQAFIQQAANHMTLLAPFMPSLAGMLPSP